MSEEGHGGTPAYGDHTPEELIRTSRRAQVWLARASNGDPVVLKVARAPEHQPALRREIDILRQLGDHPHLVGLREASSDGAWMTTDRVSGAQIDEWAAIQEFDEIVRVALQLVSLLEHLHAQGVVHGDLKPSNVLVDERGDVRVLDFGVATVDSEPEPEAPSDAEEPTIRFRGTLGYAAPELLRGAPPDAACDLYGLGALLYTAVTKRTPFVAADPAALTYLPLVSLPAPPAAFRPDIPSALNQLLLTLLSRTPTNRPTLSRVRDTLARASTSRPPPPVLGMLEERETLRRAVVGTADGEPRVVLIYGPPGSGRRTLISEAVEYARREGLPYLKGNDLRTALTSLRETDRSAVIVMRAESTGALKLAQVVLKEGLRCLLLLLADRPAAALAQRGAIQLTPAPLDLKDATRLARMWGADLERVEGWWRESLGMPIALLGRIRAWRRETNDEPMQELALPPESRRILEVLRRRGELEVPALARELGVQEHALLDQCEVLFAERLIGPTREGLAIQLLEAH